MPHLIKTTVISVLALMAGSAHAADATARQLDIHFGLVPGVNDTRHLGTLPVPGSASRPGARGAVVATGSAPALSYLQISNIGSSQVGWEAIGAAQTHTAQDHGGAQLRVVTDELGYGHVRVARFNGGVLPISANHLTQRICWNGSAYVLSCSAGQTVAGFRRYWKLDGKQNGSFSYQNSSTNPPWNTMSDSISIF